MNESMWGVFPLYGVLAVFWIIMLILETHGIFAYMAERLISEVFLHTLHIWHQISPVHSLKICANVHTKQTRIFSYRVLTPAPLRTQIIIKY